MPQMNSAFCRGIDLLSAQEPGFVQGQGKAVESHLKSVSEHMKGISGVPKNVMQLQSVLDELTSKVIMIAI
jgi:hypothetical protein